MNCPTHPLIYCPFIPQPHLPIRVGGWWVMDRRMDPSLHPPLLIEEDFLPYFLASDDGLTPPHSDIQEQTAIASPVTHSFTHTHT
mmetsp:Transcript_18971/g.26132  ORF Transcript_18971/g.26132 Transcript_18971/m.26132 type:complete len:85 (+) Transcript_18971:1-255(+)